MVTGAGSRIGPGLAAQVIAIRSTSPDARIRLVTGTQHPAHTRAIEERTAETLRTWGADARLVFLGDRGIVGNGHFLFFESNSDGILHLAREQIDYVAGA